MPVGEPKPNPHRGLTHTTTDLWMLLASTTLHWALIMIDAATSIGTNGMMWAMGNRPDPKPPTPMHGRLKKTVSNFAENLPFVAIVVLIAHVTGTANDTTALGATTSR